MKPAKTVLLAVVFALLVGVAAWMARGVFDRHRMMEGHIHVVSHAQHGHDVVLEFPSGAKVDFRLESHGSVDLAVHDTGEGAITVWIDGESRDQIGYVTSINSMVVLVIGDQKTGFSQIFPSLADQRIVPGAAGG